MATTKTTLKMVFRGTGNTGEETFRTVSLDNPRTDLTEDEIRDFMTLCVTKQALFLSGTENPVTGVHEAYREVTTRTPIIAAPVTTPQSIQVSQDTRKL